VDKDAKENGGIEKTAPASPIEPSAPGAAWMNDLDLLHQCLQFCKNEPFIPLLFHVRRLRDRCIVFVGH
jgi:hypothetical protein